MSSNKKKTPTEPKGKKKPVALVLASGGAKGFAHIGAIEELENQGYEIASIAGTSMGALVGGIYAAGGLDQVKEWMYHLTRKKVFSLADFTWSTHALLKGNRLMKALQEQVPDTPIEQLRIPFCAVATDLRTGSEVVFRSGSLYEAIRASISVPMLFTPVEMDDMLLVDGGITNGLPLDQVKRTPGDLLVAVNLEDYRWEESDDTPPQKVKTSSQGHQGKTEHTHTGFQPLRKIQNSINALSNNYISLTYDTLSILMKRNTEMALRLTPPDLYLNVELGDYGSYDYDCAEEIAALGREQMRKTILDYEHT